MIFRTTYLLITTNLLTTTNLLITTKCDESADDEPDVPANVSEHASLIGSADDDDAIDADDAVEIGACAK